VRSKNLVATSLYKILLQIKRTCSTKHMNFALFARIYEKGVDLGEETKQEDERKEEGKDCNKQSIVKSFLH